MASVITTAVFVAPGLRDFGFLLYPFTAYPREARSRVFLRCCVAVQSFAGPQVSVVHRLRYCADNALREAAKASIPVTLGVYGHVLPRMTRDAVNVVGDLLTNL